MVNGTQDNSRVRRGIRVTPGAKAEGSSPGGIRSALDRGANREQGVEKQIPGILQLMHRVYDLFPPAGDAEVCPLSPACCPIFQTSSALTSRRYGLP